MNHYFTSKDAGKRYSKYRPKVHDIVIDWLRINCPNRRFERGVDIACGTGDSLRPLIEICDDVVGVDSSDEMLSVALEHGFSVTKGDYRSVAELGTFDLLSTCMAFHWFDPDLALAAYKDASNDGAVWLIYNFALAGHATSDLFNRWYLESYMKEYPSPPRSKVAAVIPDDDKSVRLIKQGRGWIPVNFTVETLVGYLSTQSNIEHAVKSGQSIDRITKRLLQQLSRLSFCDNFKYSYSYEIYEFTRS